MRRSNNHAGQYVNNSAGEPPSTLDGKSPIDQEDGRRNQEPKIGVDEFREELLPPREGKLLVGILKADLRDEEDRDESPDGKYDRPGNDASPPRSQGWMLRIGFRQGDSSGWLSDSA